MMMFCELWTDFSCMSCSAFDPKYGVQDNDSNEVLSTTVKFSLKTDFSLP